MNESSVPLYRIGKKTFYNKPRVGSIVRILDARALGIHPVCNNTLWKVMADSEYILNIKHLHILNIKHLHGYCDSFNSSSFTLPNKDQDITWELVLE